MAQPGFRNKCPRCGGYDVRKQHGVSKFEYRCYGCYWAGNEPSLEPRVRTAVNRVHENVHYEQIIQNLLSGDTIQDQLKKFGVFKPKVTDGREHSIKQKVMRVYGAYSQYTGISCEDPNYTKIHVPDDVLRLLSSAIEEEEARIRNSPRLSITFRK